MDKLMEEIIEKMAEEGKPMINLAGLFIKEPLSLMALLMLEDNGPVTIEHISNEITGNVKIMIKITDLLDSLKGFGVIDIKDNIVNITARGQCIVAKLRMKMNSIHEDGDKLCDMKHFCVYDTENC